jgi:DNA-directed RNA polymerase specialized sigma24 family protein
MSDFRPRSEPELVAMKPEALLAYHHEARMLGRHDEARAALGVLVFGLYDRIKYWVWRSAPEAAVDDIAGEAIVSAIKSSFDGTTVPELTAWVRRIVRRRVADYHEAAKRRPNQDPLPDEHGDDEDVWGPSGWLPDPTEEVVVGSLVEQALGELNPVHRRVVGLAGAQDLGFEDRPAREAAELVNDQLSDQMDDPMTETNVHKILSRFRKRLADLDDGDGGGASDG